MKASLRSQMPSRLLLLVFALAGSLGFATAEEPTETETVGSPSREAARRFGQKLLGTGGGQLGFDGPIKIEKDESGLEKAVFCVRNSGLEPKGVTVVAGSARSEIGVLDPGEKKCSRIDVSELGGDPAGQLRIQEHGPW